ncbi:hypothetical protein KP509_27G064200 [Ceratopteris richardii]|nr:hypothetical protein KP509_27G064200 [Ceratopteris richardii]
MLQDAETGMHIHANMGCLENEQFVATSLIDMYAKCGMLDRAQTVFDRLTVHDVISWNALLAGYSHNGYGHKALSCFEQMQSEGFHPDAVTFTCSLKACGIVGDGDKGTAIHDRVRKLGLIENNIILGNALVDMYAKCGKLEKAQEVFDALRNRNVVSWTSLLAGYAQHERSHDALTCFERMLQHDIAPDAATFSSALKACGGLRDVNKGIQLHADVERRGTFNDNVIIGNALVDMYAKCGLMNNACEVFDNLAAHDVVSWTALICGYAQHEYGEEALALFEQMRSEGIPINDVTVSCSLKACGSIGALNNGIKIHNDIEQNGMLKTSQLVCNTLIDMYSKCGMIGKAHYFFDKLCIRDVVTWTVLLTGYAQTGAIDQVFHLYNAMCQQGFKPNSITFLSILTACSHAGLLEEGQIFYDIMTRKYEIFPTAEHDTCVVDLLSRAGQLEKAVLLMKEMPSYPNLALWLTVLGACRKWGNLELGCHAFQKALEVDVRDPATYISMCNVFTDAGMEEHFREVEEIGFSCMCH